jgi:hypothetical protein
MPFKSQAQAGYLHSHPEILGKKGLAEWDAATKGKHLPMRVTKYHNGTDYVPHDMLAHLDKGEAVITKKDNPMAQGDWRDAVKGKDRKPPKHIKRMIHEKTDNGKHIVTHEHHHPEHHRDEKHAFDNFSDVLDHMQKHAGPANDGEAPDASAAPMTAAAPAMPSPDAGAAPGAMPTPGA